MDKTHNQSQPDIVEWLRQPRWVEGEAQRKLFQAADIIEQYRADQQRDEKLINKLREWQVAILGKCKASDGFDALKWGGDKEGWGFIHYFIGHLETRALHAETVLAEQDHARSGVRITDAMVQEACDVYSDVYIDQDKDMGDAMRAAIKAALAVSSAEPSMVKSRTDREGGWNAERSLSVTSTEHG